MFQFLIGSLVTIGNKWIFTEEAVFQFLIGSLVTRNKEGFYAIKQLFQFLIGSLVTFKKSMSCKQVSAGFNSL